MARCWVIAPGGADWAEFEEVWKYDLENNVISIGWVYLGDLSGLDELTLKAQIKKKWNENWGSPSQGTLTRCFNTFWTFYHVIKEGDIIIARRGRKEIAAIGTATQTAFYDENKGKESEWGFANFIGVEWHDSPRNLRFDKIVFSMHTLYEIPEDKYKSLVGGIKEPVEEVKECPEFVLEKYLEDFIVSNFDRIFKGNLILYKDAETGDLAQQYPTEVGEIDILATEPGSNSFVVIELKKGQESDKVVAQTLRYMGWVKENLCEDDQEVKGIIICKEADDKLKYALTMVNNVGLKYYRVNFELLDK